MDRLEGAGKTKVINVYPLGKSAMENFLSSSKKKKVHIKAIQSFRNVQIYQKVYPMLCTSLFTICIHYVFGMDGMNGIHAINLQVDFHVFKGTLILNISLKMKKVLKIYVGM